MSGCFFNHRGEKIGTPKTNRKAIVERLVTSSLFVCAAFSIIFVLAIVFYMLYLGSPQLINDVLHGFEYKEAMFGTLYVALMGTLLAVFVGLPCAIYMAEFVNMKIRNVLKTSLEVLDGFPSIVIGVVGWEIFSVPSGPYSINVFLHSLGLTGSGSIFFGFLIIAIMSFPVIATISEDAIRAVPNELKEASLGIGATKWQTTTHVLIPYAMSNIVASILLALAAAMGETVALTWVTGRGFTSFFWANPFNPLQQGVTLTLQINQDFIGLNEGGGAVLAPHLYAASFMLFVMIGLVNISIRIFLANRNKRMKI